MRLFKYQIMVDYSYYFSNQNYKVKKLKTKIIGDNRSNFQ